MKNLMIATLFSLTAVACSTQNNSEINDTASITRGKAVSLDAVKWSETETVTLTRDRMPVDGNKTVVTLQKDEDDRYSATMVVSWYNRIEGRLESQTTELGDRLDCESIPASELTAASARCQHPGHLADGVWAQIFITDDGKDAYQVKRSTSWYDWTSGGMQKEEQDLGGGMKLSIGIESPRLCTAIAGVLFNPQTGSCDGFTNGCQQVSMLEAGYQQPEAGQCN